MSPEFAPLDQNDDNPALKSDKGLALHRRQVIIGVISMEIQWKTTFVPSKWNGIF